jgi:hypothetical protein
MDQMLSSRIRRGIAVSAACVVSAFAVGGATASAPIVQTSSAHIVRPFVDCADFGVIGSWDIEHRLTLFVDDTGTPIRDIERVEFAGRLINAETGTWVPDSGIRIFFDTLAPDGSFLTTIVNDIRKSNYVHGAGRFDFQTGTFHGTDALSPTNISALCEALAE